MATGGGERRPKRASEAGGWREERERKRENTLHICHQI